MVFVSMIAEGTAGLNIMMIAASEHPLEDCTLQLVDMNI